MGQSPEWPMNAQGVEAANLIGAMTAVVYNVAVIQRSITGL